jgi:hypothetical protein
MKTDYDHVKNYRDRYAEDEEFRNACHAAFEQHSINPVEKWVSNKQEAHDIFVFITQEAMYQMLENSFYPCRATIAE